MLNEYEVCDMFEEPFIKVKATTPKEASVKGLVEYIKGMGYTIKVNMISEVMNNSHFRMMTKCGNQSNYFDINYEYVV